MSTEQTFLKRVAAYELVVIVLSLIFALFMDGTLQIVFSVAFWIGGILYAFNDGAYLGEKAVSNQKRAEEHKNDHPELAAALENSVYGVPRAIRAALFSSLPLLGLIVLHILLTFLLPPDGEASAMARLISLFVLSPFTFIRTILQAAWGYVDAGTQFDLFVKIERATALLMLPGAFVIPAVMLGGYLNGPRLYEKKMKNIEKGTRRKLRRMRGGRKPPKASVPEV